MAGTARAELLLAGEILVLLVQALALAGLIQRKQIGRVMAGTAFVWWAVTVVGLIPGLVMLWLLWSRPPPTTAAQLNLYRSEFPLQ
jgi:hypothetical protein